MKNFYILKTNKSLIKSFFESNVWNWETMTSVIVEKDFKLIQIFGCAGEYAEINEKVKLISDQTGRFVGYGMVKDAYVNEIKKVSAYYVFK